LIETRARRLILASYVGIIAFFAWALHTHFPEQKGPFVLMEETFFSTGPPQKMEGKGRETEQWRAAKPPPTVPPAQTKFSEEKEPQAEAVLADQTPSSVSLEPKTTPLSPKRYATPKRLSLTHGVESDLGFGDVRNYTILGLLLAPEYQPGRILSMWDLRVQDITASCKANTYAADLGFIARYVPKKGCRLLGLNAYYDYRQGEVAEWSQAGVGLESLGKRWDLRANGYFPLSMLQVKKKEFDYEGDFFAILRKFEYAYGGFNAEVGFKAVRSKDFTLYAAGGPYYLHGGCESHSWGGKARLRFQYKDFASLGFSISHDAIFDTVRQIQIIFSIPLYPSPSKNPRKAPCGLDDKEIYQPVERFEQILLRKACCWESNF